MTYYNSDVVSRIKGSSVRSPCILTVITPPDNQSQLSIMARGVTKVVYKPDSQSTDEFIAIVNPVEYKKWKEGDTTVPLADVVDSFQIFHTGQGTQGILGKVSKQQLDTVFNTTNEDEAMKILLQKGREQSSEGISGGVSTSTNPSRGSAGIDTRGKMKP